MWCYSADEPPRDEDSLQASYTSRALRGLAGEGQSTMITLSQSLSMVMCCVAAAGRGTGGAPGGWKNVAMSVWPAMDLLLLIEAMEQADPYGLP